MTAVARAGGGNGIRKGEPVGAAHAMPKAPVMAKQGAGNRLLLQLAISAERRAFDRADGRMARSLLEPRRRRAKPGPARGRLLLVRAGGHLPPGLQPPDAMTPWMRRIW